MEAWEKILRKHVLCKESFTIVNSFVCILLILCREKDMKQGK